MTNIDETTRKVVADLDHSVRPQDDLFRFVNGKWMAENEIPSDQASTGSFIDLRNESERRVREIIEDLAAQETETPAGGELSESAKIGALFNSFMDEDRVEALGASPMDEDFKLIDVVTSKEELTVALGTLYASGVGAPFDFDIDADRNDPDHYIIWLGQSGLGLPDEAYYRAEEYAEILEQYKEFVPKLYALGRKLTVEAASGEAQAVVDFETKLAKHHFSVVESRDADKTNNVMTWADFIASAPGFDWEKAFGLLGITEENAPQILVYQPRALTGFAQLWEESSLEDLKSYLRWRVIRARAGFLNSEIVQTNFDFYGKVLSGQEQLRDRWKRGVGLVDSVMGEAVGREYVARHFPPEYKAQMEQLVEDLLSAYRESITDLDWMTPETKDRALEKLGTFVTKIAYPEKWRDYSALVVDPEDLVGNVRAASRFELEYEVAKLGTDVDRGEWHMYPQTVNAYYNPVANEIVFPAAILQPPFFDPEADDAWNYGGIGAVIGHEIGHGFDDQGSKYDGSGMLNNWWTDADRTEFEARTSALVAQYDSYVPAQLGPDSPHHVQGALTLGENIGDLGGLSIGLKAYAIAMKREGYESLEDVPELEGYTAVQRLLLSYARIWQEKRRDELMIQRVATDPHSPAEFRCNGVVKNVDAFAEAFDVKEGDELYLDPNERVRIW